MRNLLQILLAVGVLFTGVPAWKHSHSGGEQPHSHSHEHDHDGVGHSQTHLHVTLLGVEFALPAASENDDSQEGQTTFLVATPAAHAVQTSHFATLSQLPFAGGGEPLQIVATFRCITASAAPLCDSARKECCGVLLI